MEYDVVIAGGGVGGLYCARELSRKGYKVILFENSSTPGEPNFSTAGTSKSIVEEFSLDRASIADEINKIIYGTLSNEHSWEFDRTIGYVLNFKKTKVILSQQAQDLGAEVVWGEKVVRPIHDRTRTTGVETKTRSVNGRYFIDATGSKRILLKQLTGKNHTRRPTIAMEYIVRQKDDTFDNFKNSMSFYFDTTFVPYGYYWVFSNGEGTYKVGICESEVVPGKIKYGLEDRLKLFTEKRFGQPKFDLIEKHANSITLQNYMHELVYGNVLGIGDTIGMINPLVGEGIRHSLKSAKFAVESISHAAENEGPLSSYENKIRNYKKRRWVLMDLLGTGLFRNKSSNTQRFYEEFIRFGKNVDADGVLDLGFDYKLSVLLKPFPKNIPLIYYFLLSYLKM